MRFHKLSLYLSSGVVIHWCGGAADMTRAKKAMLMTYGADLAPNIKTEEVVIPTAKNALLAWLNTNVNSRPL